MEADVESVGATGAHSSFHGDFNMAVDLDVRSAAAGWVAPNDVAAPISKRPSMLISRFGPKFGMSTKSKFLVKRGVSQTEHNTNAVSTCIIGAVGQAVSYPSSC